MPRLILHAGRIDERVFQLVPGVNTIGRSEDNDVAVPHQSLSREHARILLDGDQAILEDLGSKNGTYLDGARVGRCGLGCDHVVRCGDVTFRYVTQGAPLTAGWHRPPSLMLDPATDPMSQSLDQLLGARRAAKVAGGPSRERNDALSTARDHQRLEILLKVSELLSSPAPIDEVLGKVLDLGFEILDIDRGTVVVLQDGQPVPRVAKARPGVPEYQAFSRQIVDYVVTRGVAALFSDTHCDARLRMEGSILRQSIVSAMCAPLKAGEHLLGALYVDNVTRPDCFDEQDLQLFSAFANQAAIAIHNATLSVKLAQEAVTRSTLMRFFPPAAIEAIIRGRDALEARECEATALFCDLSGYTALSSRMAPKDVIRLLNAFFPVMAEIVFRHEGTLEKYIGDALLAVWGVPFPHEDDPERAVRAAVDMQYAVKELVERGRLPASLAVHIGVNTGRVAAGGVGSEQFLQYATIGDATNVASRICGLATAREILVGEGTAARLGPGWTFERLDPVLVKGKEMPLIVSRILWDQASGRDLSPPRDAPR